MRPARILTALGRVRAERRTLARAFLAVAGAQIALDALGAGRVLAGLRRIRGGLQPERASDSLEGVSWAVRVADRVLPGRASCLRRSVAAYWLLRSQSRVKLFISARPGRGGLTGHAWVRVGRKEIVPAGEFEGVQPVWVIRPA